MPDSEGLFSKTPIEVKLEAEITRLRAELAEVERERDVLRENVKEILEDEKCSLNQCILEYRFNEAYANADSRAERAEANLALARSIMSIRDLNRFDILLKETK